jgi:hypothetical protein
VSYSGSAQELVGSADDSYSLVVGQAVGGGTIIVSGDSNIFSDNDDGFHEAYDNNQLTADICP